MSSYWEIGKLLDERKVDSDNELMYLPVYMTGMI